MVKKKPNDVNVFLHKFIDELIDVMDRGLYISDNQYYIYVLGFCCDAPAKSFILGVTGHTGYRSCTRCKVHGITVERRRVFLDTNAEPRTHDEFINRVDSVFQPRTTPLTRIPGLNLVKSVILDYMHLICLGVMRTLLFIWTNGPLPLRLSPTQRRLVSESLVSFRVVTIRMQY